jgi:hypothetical protein
MFQRLFYVLCVRIEILIKEGFDSHDHSRRAKPTLDRSAFDKCRLNRVKFTFRGQPLDGLDTSSIHFRKADLAGPPRFSVNDDGARAAMTCATSVLAPHQAETVA